MVAPAPSQPVTPRCGKQGVENRCEQNVATVQDRSLRACALSEVLNGKPLSRRYLARALGIHRRIVDWWCSGVRPIQEDRLRHDAPIVHARWSLRLEEMSAERMAA